MNHAHTIDPTRAQTASPKADGGDPLAPAVPGRMAPASGHDASTVRIHQGRTAEDLGALTSVHAGGSGGGPLPGGVRRDMERSFGADLSGVTVREDPAVRAMGARAFTRGNDIHFAPGQLDVASRGGRELLGHELTHVIQQRQGTAATQAKGAGGDPALEAEADEVGARAAAGERVTVRGATAVTTQHRYGLSMDDEVVVTIEGKLYRGIIRRAPDLQHYEVHVYELDRTSTYDEAQVDRDSGQQAIGRRDRLPPPRRLRTAILEDRPMEVLTLLDVRTPTDGRDEHGGTPLHLAARKPSPYLVGALLNAGADPAAIDTEGNTPLHLAVQAGNKPCVQLLVRAGGQVWRKNKQGASPRDLAKTLGKDLLPLLVSPAEEFEVKLARYLYGRGEVDETLVQMLERAKAVLRYTHGCLTKDDDERFKRIVAEHLGTDDPTKGGAVGKDEQVVFEMLEHGNLREHMTAINMFGKSSGRDLSRTTQDWRDTRERSGQLDEESQEVALEGPSIVEHSYARAKQALPVDGKHLRESMKARKKLAQQAARGGLQVREQRLDRLHLDFHELDDRLDPKSEDPREVRNETGRDPSWYIKRVETDPLGFQDDTRRPRDPRTSTRTPQDLRGAPLSSREQQLIEDKGGEHALEGTLPWIEGGSSLAVDPDHPWVLQQLQRGVPLLGGPSGTTERLLQLAELLGISPEKLAAACLAWMLPGTGNDHSFYEIMSVANPHLKDGQGTRGITYDMGLDSIGLTGGSSKVKRDLGLEGLPAFGTRPGKDAPRTGIGEFQCIYLRAANETYRVWLDLQAQVPRVRIRSFDGSGELVPHELRKELEATERTDKPRTMGLLEALDAIIEIAENEARLAASSGGLTQTKHLQAATLQLDTIAGMVPKILSGLVEEEGSDGGAIDLYKGVQLGGTLDEDEYQEKLTRQEVGAPTLSPAVRELAGRLVAQGIGVEEAQAQAIEVVDQSMKDLEEQHGGKLRGTAFETALEAMIDLYVKNLKQLKTDLKKGSKVPWAKRERTKRAKQERDVYTSVPAISTTKNARTAVIYAAGDKKDEGKKRREGVTGLVYVYVIPRAEYHRLRKIDILEMNQRRGYRTDAHKVTESEVTFLTQVPGQFLVDIVHLHAGMDHTELAELVKQRAREHGGKHGGLRRWEHLG